MHWTEPATADDSHAELEKKLWDAANQLWAGADLKPSEYSPTVLGLIFLRYADVRFVAVEKDLKPPAGSRRKIGPTDYHAAGVVYLPDDARFSHLLSLPESGNVGQAINEAMRAIEKENPDLADVLPKSYHILESRTLASLLKTMASISMDKGGDTFGLIYEYFLGKFAMSEGQKGGEFYTPTSIVKLIVEILEPYHGRILDPACGSGGMFIQSARFDFVLANPPFNVRYVGVAKGEDLSDEDFKEQLEALNEELEVLNAEARELEARIAVNVTELLEA